MDQDPPVHRPIGRHVAEARGAELGTDDKRPAEDEQHSGLPQRPPGRRVDDACEHGRSRIVITPQDASPACWAATCGGTAIRLPPGPD